ncbi:hypothetical protein CDAR_406931 [Caerostris darwini]|uniref:Cuticle protein 16.8 n=1 Tax=Caerostris darwini TaxID=1538125 RepID=A0AAV4R8D6_9ARAC|nr:hypothetical protein CDAR_406931 [Caerostris darwini]
MIFLAVLSCIALAQAQLYHDAHDHHHHHHAQPYKFGYSVKDHHGEQHREESGNGAGGVVGSYGFSDSRGVARQVNYVADHAGFRAEVKTNEPGTANQNPAAVHLVSNAPYAHSGGVAPVIGGLGYGGNGGYGLGYGGYGLGYGGYGGVNEGYGAGYGGYGRGYNGYGGYGGGYNGNGQGYGGYGGGYNGYGQVYGGYGLNYNGYGHGGALGYSGLLGGYGYSYSTPLKGGSVSGYDSRGHAAV